MKAKFKKGDNIKIGGKLSDIIIPESYRGKIKKVKECIGRDDDGYWYRLEDDCDFHFRENTLTLVPINKKR